jgi:hypothetical protein
MGIDLPLLWSIIIGFGLMMYVGMDGFDLGIGILFPFIPRREHRDVMVNTVAPVWDSNETWLVFGAAALMAAFPLAFLPPVGGGKEGAIIVWNSAAPPARRPQDRAVLTELLMLAKIAL